jgi:hypothetical protein
MKRFIILFALISLAICIPFTLATDSTDSTIGKYINSGATVFIGEEGLNITDAVGTSTSIGWWGSGADITRTSPYKTILIINRKTAFYVTPSEFLNSMGNWYRLTPDGHPNGIADGHPNGIADGHPNGIAFNVQDPYLDIQIWNKDTNEAIYNNKVSSGTNVTFRINSNLHQITYKRYNDSSHTEVPSTDGFINIRVITSNGASYTKLVGSDESLENIFITSPNHIWAGSWNTNAYTAGTYTIYAETNVNHIRDNYKQGGADYTGKTISPIYALNIIQSSISISSNKENIIRGKTFTITVTGNPNAYYYLWVTNTNNIDDELSPPRIQPYQDNVEIGVGGEHISTSGIHISDDVASAPSPNPYYARIKTDTSGIRNISFTTFVNTSSQKYTIRVESDDINVKYDEVMVTVGEGGLTIVANGDQSYYLGETIKFEGINTETSTTYLFIYGPNLPVDGARINNLDPRHFEVVNGNASTFKQVTVNGDGTWSWDWNTASLALDSGTYIVYAVSLPRSKSHIVEAAYSTTSIRFTKPTLTVSIPPSVAKGDPLKIKGYAEGQPSKGIAIWIMGTNYNKRNVATVHADSSFEYELTRIETEDMSAGQYFVVLQHPMQNGKFDIVLNPDGSISNLQLINDHTNTESTYIRVNNTDGTYYYTLYNESFAQNEGSIKIFQFSGVGALQGSDAANALIKAIDNPNIDDMYIKAYFTISNPIITIDEIGDKYIADKFTITGQTNLNIDTTLTMDIVSSTFKPTNKSESNEFSGLSITMPVISDDNSSGYNKYIATIDTSTFKPDEYIVTVSSIENDVTASTLFLIKNGIRPSDKITIQKTTTPSTHIPTITPTEAITPTPSPTKSSLIPGVAGLPGFTSILTLLGVFITIIFIRRK